MSYVVPEVLLGDKPFGIIIVKMLTGQKPFDKHEFNLKLAVEICKKSQPKIVSGLDADNVIK
ncbi:hypothetical protein C2G38_2155110 [Gigaspora rosea]|uniref:Uncharacterized protein n=1 Tax=Gigaspora rosea TaxID=44941 RepID=A0A397W456_9GLOM|nr:hypothetical protein C2G38_2155110 [Gigaspora rosea]